MRRLVVLIGVRQPGGGLDELESIGKCLEDMRDWALSQGIPRSDIKIFTDIPEQIEAGDPKPLSIAHIYDWIDARAKESQPADQLVIYFSGHGMESGGTPLWLLPQAPNRSWEAINLDSSAKLAIWSRFKHIVFIGDCCATVADNAQFDMVRGAPILENTPEQLRINDRPVDYLRAARPGKASLEIVLDGVSQSPYTVQLVKTLSGTPSTILETQNPGAPEPVVLRVRKLADELRISVNTFLRANGIKPPGPPLDSVVSTTQWIALFPSLPVPVQPPSYVPAPPPQLPLPPGPSPAPPGLKPPSVGVTPSGPVMGGQGSEATQQLRLNLGREFIETGLSGLTGISETNWSSAIPDGYHYETQCGFFIVGASVLSAESRPGVVCELVSAREIKIEPEAMELVSIEFVGGGGIMLPAIAGQIGFIHVENGRLSSVAYEPSGHANAARKSGHRREFEVKSNHIRELRDTLQNVVTGGNLGFTDISPRAIFRAILDINYGGRVDFSTLLYLAYAAYASTLANRVIPLLADYMQRQFTFVPFDLKILLTLARIEYDPGIKFAPPFPLLTQGWSLLQATHEELPKELTTLPDHYRNAPWTHLDAVGVGLCRAYLAKQSSGGTLSGDNPIEDAILTISEEPAQWLQLEGMEMYDWRSQASADDEEALEI